MATLLLKLASDTQKSSFNTFITAANNSVDAICSVKDPQTFSIQMKWDGRILFHYRPELEDKKVSSGFSSLLRQRTHFNRWKVLQERGLLWHSCKIQLHFHERTPVATIQGSFCKFNDIFPTSIGCTGTCIDKRNRW